MHGYAYWFHQRNVTWRSSCTSFMVWTKKSITELGLGHQKIDACKNDCVLFWKEYEGREKCPICEAPRFKKSLQEESQADCQKKRLGKWVPNKVLRYFSLKDRLQKLFMSSKIAKWMTWHNDGWSLRENGEMQHLVDLPT